MDVQHITTDNELAYFCPTTGDLSDEKKEGYEEVEIEKELRMFNTEEARNLIKSLVERFITKK